MLRITFVMGATRVLALALAIGTYLHFSWQPRRQVQLHTKHFLQAVEQLRGGLTGPVYRRELFTIRGPGSRVDAIAFEGGSPYLHNLRMVQKSVLVWAATTSEWRAVSRMKADATEVSVRAGRVNALAMPFELRWQQQSGKPWDWQLTG